MTNPASFMRIEMRYRSEWVVEVQRPGRAPRALLDYEPTRSSLGRINHLLNSIGTDLYVEIDPDGSVLFEVYP